MILTKVDEICEEVSGDVSKVFRSETVKQCVEEMAEKVGIPVSFVLPVSLMLNVKRAIF